MFIICMKARTKPVNVTQVTPVTLVHLVPTWKKFGPRPTQHPFCTHVSLNTQKKIFCEITG